jgi:hypothetical protein
MTGHWLEGFVEQANKNGITDPAQVGDLLKVACRMALCNDPAYQAGFKAEMEKQGLLGNVVDLIRNQGDSAKYKKTYEDYQNKGFGGRLWDLFWRGGSVMRGRGAAKNYMRHSDILRSPAGREELAGINKAQAEEIRKAREFGREASRGYGEASGGYGGGGGGGYPYPYVPRRWMPNYGFFG